MLFFNIYSYAFNFKLSLEKEVSFITPLTESIMGVYKKIGELLISFCSRRRSVIAIHV
jgi:hypothetical protein